MKWQPIEKNQKLKKGMIRIYSYAPLLNGKNYLARKTTSESPYGCRICDYYIDIPEPPENEQSHE